MFVSSPPLLGKRPSNGNPPWADKKLRVSPAESRLLNSSLKIVKQLSPVGLSIVAAAVRERQAANQGSAYIPEDWLRCQATVFGTERRCEARCMDPTFPESLIFHCTLHDPARRCHGQSITTKDNVEASVLTTSYPRGITATSMTQGTRTSNALPFLPARAADAKSYANTVRKEVPTATITGSLHPKQPQQAAM
ncbi:unnamed protein product [Mortierella alpina]